MNIPKHIIAFIDTCPAKSRPALVFAIYTHMSGNAVDTKFMSKTDADLWRKAFGILQPILAKRERDRLYRQRRKARLQQATQNQKADQTQTAQPQTTQKKSRSDDNVQSRVREPSRARFEVLGKDQTISLSRGATATEDQSAIDALSELLEILDNNSDSSANTSQPTMQYYKPGDIAPGRVVPNSRVEPEMLADIRDICRTYMPTTRHKAANERRVQTELRELYGEYFSHVCYFPDSGRMILYAAKPTA